MSFHALLVLAAVVESSGIASSGEEVHCIGEQAHVLRYDVDGEPNDGTSMESIKNAIIAMEPSPKHAAKCEGQLRGTPEETKAFCYGANQDSTCAAAKADIPLGKDNLDCKDCFVSATADLFYKLNYSYFMLKSVEVGLQDLHLRASAALHTVANASKTVEKHTKVIADNSTRWTLIDKMVGCPICVRVEITLATPTSLDYEVTLKSQADITAGAQLDIHLGDRGIKWDHVEGWTLPKENTTVSVLPVLSVDKVQAEADLNLWMQTGLQMDMANVMWYHFSLQPSFLLKCTSAGRFWPFHGPTEGCLKGDAALTIVHEADLHWSLASFHENHHWGPRVDYTWSKPDVINVCKKFGAASFSDEAALVV